MRCSIIAKRLHRYLRPDSLPPEAKVGSEHCYQRHCIHEDPAGRFCVGSFVWKPGQETPVHDHSCWGVVGVVRGSLASDNFVADRLGQLASGVDLRCPRAGPRGFRRRTGHP